ncbi:hypothetical protein BREU_1401 [Bifidobacterium reuteri DSM 23975]|uniref:Uncharacterized protein n=1 Tax=Bifidobacterium reuteri DSM 23975 TaxID=1437610 RepID=A0A087CSH8_9BIFI|nr:hypothetical protein [Bifidobacterium reuteri]KFI86228.1 hypothetical protein BREU_1401 [Bifidobacterium reuteri DSM 23975]
MNVSESIDWEHTPIDMLHRHRFIARTQEGQTLDGWLCYETVSPHGGSSLFDWDHMTEVIIPRRYGLNVLHQFFRSVNVLKEIRVGRQ